MLLDIEHLSYKYPHSKQYALRDISLSVAPGEFVLLAGPSGSGKSTLLRCLNGLVPHFSGGTVSGAISVNGVNVLADGPQVLSRHVGLVLQSPEAQAILDVVEPEVAFSLENAAIPPQEMRLRVEEALDLLGLTPLRDRPLTTLSGGERQRVAIASALALRPEILVLDEPTSQLDPQSAEEVLQALVRLNEDLGLTIILAEQRLERVMRYADRVIFLDGGRVVVDDDVRSAAAAMPQVPPLVDLARRLRWSPLPLTVKEGRRMARRLEFDPAVRTPESGVPACDGFHAGYSANGSLLKASEIHFSYNGKPALNGVNLSVAAGEVVALMGRNGSGKSTLLKCLVGLLPLGDGDVTVDGVPNRGRHVAEICREVAYLPQNPDDLLFAESVSEELAVTLHNHRLPPSQSTISNLLGQLSLSDVAQAYPRDLSVGQRQRVALGAVAVTRPKLLLLDEPTRGLDYRTKQALVSIWRRWLAEGMGILLVTHDVELAAMIADRVIVLSQGEVIAAGRAVEILGSSPLFSTQIARLFPGAGCLTVGDVLNGSAPWEVETSGREPAHVIGE